MINRDTEVKTLFLAEFRNGSNTKWITDKNYYKTQTYSYYLGDLRYIFSMFVNNNLVEKMTPSQIISYNYKLADLKNECKKRGLKISGKKDDLAERLLETDPKILIHCKEKNDLWICTDTGMNIITSYYDHEEKRENAMRDKVFILLRSGNFHRAITEVETFRNQKIFPDWMGPRPLSLSSMLNVIQIIWFETPKCLYGLSKEYLEEAKTLISYDMLRGSNEIRKNEKKPTNVDGLSIGKAMQILMFYSTEKKQLLYHQSLKVIKNVSIEYPGDKNNLCPSCRKIVGKIYPINNVPAIPYEGCQYVNPCLLTYNFDADYEPKRKKILGLF